MKEKEKEKERTVCETEGKIWPVVLNATISVDKRQTDSRKKKGKRARKDWL